MIGRPPQHPLHVGARGSFGHIVTGYTVAYVQDAIDGRRQIVSLAPGDPAVIDRVERDSRTGQGTKCMLGNDLILMNENGLEPGGVQKAHLLNSVAQENQTVVRESPLMPLRILS